MSANYPDQPGSKQEQPMKQLSPGNKRAQESRLSKRNCLTL